MIVVGDTMATLEGTPDPCRLTGCDADDDGHEGGPN